MKIITLCALFCAVLFNQYQAHEDDNEFCEYFGATPQCDPTAYRSIDGTCNNLRYPTMGAANTRLARFFDASYSDQRSAMPKAVSGNDLPSARFLSTFLFNETSVPHELFTFVFMQFGQLMAHDMADGGHMMGQNGCCINGKLAESPDSNCIAIPVPPDDPIHVDVECQDFLRDVTDLDSGCPNLSQDGVAQQVNPVTHFADLSVVYGSSDHTLEELRAYEDGLMKVERRRGRDWMPHNPDDADVCDVQPGGTCYLGGDSRANAFPHLTILHTIFLREHNRIAKRLKRMNENWDDEKIFQEARKINIAQYQNIVYEYWLTKIFGKDQMIAEGLLYDTEGFVNDYDETIDPSTINEHTSAAMRFFHTQIEGQLKLLSESRELFDTHRLMDDFNKPTHLEEGDNFEGLARGMATQPCQATDKNYDAEIISFFGRGNKQFGDDLKAMDIQRDRDHGIVKYNDARAACGLKRAQCWDDFLDVMSRSDVNRLRVAYEDLNDIDLTVGGGLERIPEGQSHGPTFNCILLRQFRNTRRGDRFYFENESTGFTERQLASIREVNLAAIMCKNIPEIKQLQPEVFEVISPDNPLTDCDQIPSVRLNLWRERS